MKDNRSVSVVVPTFNNVRLLRDCLASLRELDYPQARLQVIVVDNGSSDGTEGMVRTRFPGVNLVKVGQNSGFAAACNRGAKEVTSEYVAFLNDDAVAEERWL